MNVILNTILKTRRSSLLRYHLLLGLSVILLLTGCNSKNVSVTRKPSPTQPVNLERDSISSSPGNADATSIVFFSMISTNFRKTPTHVDGLGFLAGNATTTQPFTYHFENMDLPYNARVFVPFAHQVLYGWQSAPDESTLSYFETKNRNNSDLSSFATSRIVSLASSQDGETMSWINEDGSAWRYEKKSELLSAIPLKDGAFAFNIQINASNSILVSMTQQGKPQFVIFSEAELATPGSMGLEVEGADASIDPRGDKVVYLKDSASNSKKVLMIYDCLTKTTFPAGVEEDQIQMPRWKNNHEVTFLSRSSKGLKFLRLLNIRTGHDSILSTLHISDSIFLDKGVVCPSWDKKGQVYFSDFQRSSFSIYRAKLSGERWNVELFARPFDENTGYICPQVVSHGD